jgi:hypothetical protein
MTPPDESGFNLWGIATSAIGGLLMLVWNMLNSKIKDNKLHHDSQLLSIKEDLEKRIVGNTHEADTQRGHIAKLFDKLEENGRRSEDRHVETLHAINALSTTMHQALATKADK